MNVHQLSIAYVPEQDRILVRVNTTQGHELRFWFTRRLTLGLAPLLDRAVTERAVRHGAPADAQVVAMDDLAKKAIAQFQRDENLKTSDFMTPYATPSDSVAVFDQPLLVTEVNVANQPGGQLRLSFAEKLSGVPGPRSFQMSLADQLLHAFVHLLERALGQSQWRVAPPDAAVQPAPMDPSQEPDKPQYRH